MYLDTYRVVTSVPRYISCREEVHRSEPIKHAQIGLNKIIWLDSKHLDDATGQNKATGMITCDVVTKEHLDNTCAHFRNCLPWINDGTSTQNWLRCFPPKRNWNIHDNDDGYRKLQVDFEWRQR